MKIIKLAAVVAGLGIVGGCADLGPLQQPANVPVYINAYKVPSLAARVKDVRCSLNLVNAVETAVVGEKALSGKTFPGQEFPVRSILRAEFETLVKENFSLASGGDQPHLEIKVETQKVILTLDGSKYRFDYSAAIKVLDPRHEEKPYLSKIYSATVRGRRVSETEVPGCVYEAIQTTVADFISDVARDKSLVARIAGLTK